MTTQPSTPAQPSAPATAPVTPLPQAVIDTNRFEGKQIEGVSMTISGSAKLSPVSTNADDVYLTHDDVVTVQMDVKVSGVGYDVDKHGNLIRVQKARPIEGTIQVVDVLRKLDTRIR